VIYTLLAKRARRGACPRRGATARQSVRLWSIQSDLVNKQGATWLIDGEGIEPIMTTESVVYHRRAMNGIKMHYAGGNTAMQSFSSQGQLLADRRFNTVRRLVCSVATLVDIARREWDTNQDAALASIAKASCLLRGEIDRPPASARQNAMRSGLLGWQARRVRDYIEAHMGVQIRVSDLSAIVQRSEGHFARAFKRSFGQTPHSYLVERRLEQASHLMLASDTSISDIAAACGFSDQAHLCHQFRRRYGTSPAAWRREKSVCRDSGTAMEIGARRYQ
jgi:AraC family transcriptional regulator